ncbi:MAG TPA: non-heme iron oxygenase ferredoxin subunit [Candidatus Polarisedimenticolaceae bacterium]|nr:non-heme iron oxygenase ferredoxin subunit [Candidatus Polarisedimenticolaceae bacterium]
MGTLHKVALAADVPPGAAIAVEAGGHSIALFNVDGSYYAVSGECTHAGAPLCEGQLAGRELTCPWHGASFDLETGRHLTPPAYEDLVRYPVRVDGGEIHVEIP